MKKWDKIILEQIIKVVKEEPKITYESGDPSKYQDQFSRLWINHMTYLESIGTFSYNINFDFRVFSEALHEFRQKHSEIKLFVAKEDQNLVGFLQAGIMPNKQGGMISDLHVLENYRGRYIGETLVKNCLRWFDNKNIKEQWVEVMGGNEKVLEFYNQYGFKTSLYTLKREI
jgi:ribosomal protein S18 acetylase RimI-like enzyme